MIIPTLATASADLELALRRWAGDDYALEARFQLAGSAAPAQLIAGDPPRVRLDFEGLLGRQLDPEAYGAALGGALFADPRAAEALARARAAAESLGAPLRLRLRLAADDDDLQALRWETLHDPAGQPLARSERILLARHLDSPDMTPLGLEPRADLSALVVVAGPGPAAQERYNLAPIDTPAELARARAALGDMPAVALASGQGRGATLDALVAGLRDGHDILYLVAHGTLRRGRPILWLDDGDGGVERVEGIDLVETVARLQRRPVLVVLASCQSAGDGAGQAMAALGPQLAAAGVAAVIAMQGNLAQESAARLLPAFFRELWRDGQVDRALAAARLALRDSGDWWMPALFMRLPDGRIWLDEAPPDERPPADVPPPPQPERPPEIAGFVGRAAELEAFAATLARDGLIVLTGMPGVGKTSTAAALARRVGEPATTFWHSFVAGEGAENLVWDLAGCLAYQGRPGLWELLQRAAFSGGQPPTLDVLIDYLVQLLDGSGLLLCLDDFHLVDEDPQLAPFLERLLPLLGAGRLRVILTSWRVPGFALAAHVELLTGLGPADAALLLAGRGVVLEPELMAALYTQVGGNAQLLTLAADALRRADAPERLIAELVDAASIERYLLDAIDAALSAEERATMRPIAALLEPGGTRAAIEAVAAGASVRRPLRSLSDRYLLLTQETAAGRAYRQHLIVQRFYYADLSRTERAELHRRAAAYYEAEEPDPLRASQHYLRAGEPARAAELASGYVAPAINAGQARALARLLAQIPADQLEPALRAAAQTALAELLALLGEYAQARELLDQALALGAPAEEQAQRQRLRAMTLERTSQYADAAAACRAGLDLLAGQPLPSLLIARLQLQLAEVLWRQGAYDAAEAACANGLAALPPAPAAPAERAALAQRRATIAHERGRYAQAAADIEQALALARQTGDQILEAALLHNLGRALYDLGQIAPAEEHLRASLTIKERLGDQLGRMLTLNQLGLIQMAAGDAAEALATFRACRALGEQAGARNVQAAALSNIGRIQLRQGRLAEAAEAFAAALAINRAIGNPLGQADALYQLAELALADGDPPAALARGQEALEVARRAGAAAYESCALRVIGEALTAGGRLAEAAAQLDLAWQIQLQVGDPYDQTLALAARSRLAHAEGDAIGARYLAARGLELARQQRSPQLVALLERVLAEVAVRPVE